MSVSVCVRKESHGEDDYLCVLSMDKNELKLWHFCVSVILSLASEALTGIG